jgi:DNA-binding transcriptional regulator LsrR (DeoR family)
LEAKIRQQVPNEVPFRLHVITAKDSPAFLEQASGHVAELLTGELIVGTMWGMTINKIISGLSRHTRPRHRYNLKAIPLAGDPLFLLNLGNQRYSASALAADLEVALMGETDPELPTLYGVPAYVSRQLMRGDDRASVVDEFIHSIPGYLSIFGAGGYVHKIDAVLTSVGVFSANHPHKAAAFIRERGVQNPADKPRMEAAILGDFAGNLIPKPGLNASDREFVESLNKGWTGISLDQLLQIARKAKTTSRPGIVTIAHSAEEKATLLSEALRRGLINHLIVDELLATELSEPLFG